MIRRSELPNLPDVNVPRSIPTATTDSTNKEGLDKAKSNKVQFKLISRKPKQFKTTRVKVEKPKVEKTPMEKEKEESIRKNTEMCIKALEYLQKGTLEDGELETNSDDENFDPSKYDLELSAEAHENESILTDNVEFNVKTGKHTQLPMRYDNLFMNKTDNQHEDNKISKHHKSKKSKRKHKDRTGPKLEHLSAADPYDDTCQNEEITESKDDNATKSTKKVVDRNLQLIPIDYPQEDPSHSYSTLHMNDQNNQWNDSNVMNENVKSSNQWKTTSTNDKEGQISDVHL